MDVFQYQQSPCIEERGSGGGVTVTVSVGLGDLLLFVRGGERGGGGSPPDLEVNKGSVYI